MKINLKNSLIILLGILVILLIIPSMVNATTVVNATETSTTSTGKIVSWKYSLNSNNEIEDLVCSNINAITGEISIPKTVDGHKVIGLGNNAFKDCSGLTGVTFNSNIVSIGSNAFQNCFGIKSIDLSTSQITKINSYTFDNCSGIKTLKLGENITTIDNFAFAYCSGITSLTLPNSVTSIGTYAFRDCSGIKSLTLSNNLSKISGACFYNCSGLVSVVLPDSVTTLDVALIYGCFEKCINLEKILIPNSVSSIQPGVFEYCNKLTIYGNEGSTAQNYANENKIKFDYIKNWDKPDAGADISAPTVKSISVSSPASGTYKTSQAVKIRVNFSERITGTKLPTLKIKFGTSAERTLTNGTITNDYIEYSYTIQNGDNGQLATVSLAGGDIKDASGNAAKLSCPIISGNTISANTATTPTQDTTKYVSFPMMIIGGKANLSIKNYDGTYKLYYQFVEVSDTVYANIVKLQEDLKNKKITYAEYLTQYKKLLPTYNESKWIETKDGSFEKNLTEFTGSKKFALWSKLVMQDKTVYDAEVYTMNGNGSANNTNDSNKNNGNTSTPTTNNNSNNSSKDDTVAGSKIPQTGATITLTLVIIATLGFAILAFRKYRTLRDI